MKKLVEKLVEVVFDEDEGALPIKEHNLIGEVVEIETGWICIQPSEEIVLHNYPQYLYMEEVWINLRFVKAVRLIRVGEMAKEPG